MSGLPETLDRPTSGAAARPGRAELALVGALALVVLLGLYLFATERSGLFKDDTRHYGLMAEDPRYLPRIPYAFRVLTPLFVHLLPFDPVTGFTVVTVAGLWLSALFLYALLRAFGLTARVGLAGVGLFLFSGATTRALTTPTYVDPLTYLTELAAFYFLQTGREVCFAATLVLGVLNRETALLLAPVYLLQCRAEGRLGRPDLARVASVLGLPLLTLLLIAALKLAAGGVAETGLGVLETKPRTFHQNLPSFQDLADIYTVFGAAWLLAPLNLSQAPPLLRRGLSYGLLVVLQLAVSRGDESRNLSHLLPLVLPLAALEFRALSWPRYAATLAGCLASLINFRWVVVPSAPIRYALVLAGTLLALALATLRRGGLRRGMGDGGWEMGTSGR